MNSNEMFRQIPKVDILLRGENMKRLVSQYGYNAVSEILQESLAELRKEAGKLAEEKDASAGAEKIQQDVSALNEKVEARLSRLFRPGIVPAVNATGTILHTGLGRAPLGEKAGVCVRRIAEGYSSLEYDLQSGKRGSRCDHIEQLVCRITGAEAALAVNNNAAAVLLILSALACGGEVVVSRGELVEIGGKFRIPDVMELSGAKLRETGTTNRTRLEDYEAAVSDQTKILMKVHTSNYKIVGFTESVSVGELCALGNRRGICVVQDLGSGVLIDLERFGIAKEPTVQESVAAGADVVCFSGDKLMGGPQAGIIAGKKKYVDKMKSHPLARALRIDKLTAAVLEQTLSQYLDMDKAVAGIPVLRMLTRPAEVLRKEAEKLAERIRTEIEKEKAVITVDACTSCVGGGALPEEKIESFAVCIRPEQISVSEFHKRLRMLPVPVIGRIEKEKILIDLRTVAEKDIQYLSEVFSDGMLYLPSGGEYEKRP